MGRTRCLWRPTPSLECAEATPARFEWSAAGTHAGRALGRRAGRIATIVRAALALTIFWATGMLTPHLDAETVVPAQRGGRTPPRSAAAGGVDAMERWRRDFSGIRTTERQVDASADPDASRRQRLLIRPVTPLEAAPGLYFYVERARLDRLQRPLLQEVWRVSAQGDRVIVERFRLKMPARFLGARSSDGLLQRLSAQDLEPIKGCGLRFVERDGRWEGTSEGRQCPSAEGGSSDHHVTLAWTASALVLDERIMDGQGRVDPAADPGTSYEFLPEEPLEATR